MKRLVSVAMVLVFAAWIGQARADDKPNPTGTWKYTTDANGQMLDVTIKLKQDGDKLTGTVSVADTEAKIEDGKYKDGDVSFKAALEFGDTKITIKYTGKVKGDIFKGKRELQRDGETNTKEFEAKRAKD